MFSSFYSGPDLTSYYFVAFFHIFKFSRFYYFAWLHTASGFRFRFYQTTKKNQLAENPVGLFKRADRKWLGLNQQQKNKNTFRRFTSRIFQSMECASLLWTWHITQTLLLLNKYQRQHCRTCIPIPLMLKWSICTGLLRFCRQMGKKATHVHPKPIINLTKKK